MPLRTLLGRWICYSSVIFALAACGGGGSSIAGGANAGSTSASITSVTTATTTSTLSSSLIAPPPASGAGGASGLGNALPVVLDAGPAAAQNAGIRAINIPYVSVTVCPPGATSGQVVCQVIDHVVLDTGSNGLRLVSSALNAQLALPAVTNASGQALGECAIFGDGFTWGSLNSADVYLAGEVAKSISIQVVGATPGNVTSIPSNCSATGGNIGTVAQMGANGILGVGLYASDCGICTTTVAAKAYYVCTAGACSGTTVTSAQLVVNPVSQFVTDNQGVLLSLPNVAATGAATLTGVAYFGIGTQTNNQTGGVQAYPVSAATNATLLTSYTRVGAGSPNTLAGFLDTGSNSLFFLDNGIASCVSGSFSSFYCPPATLNLTATNTARTGSPSAVVSFTVVNANALSADRVAAPIAAPFASSTQFDWGLPFFFGRPVFTAIENATTPLGKGPYWAY